MGTEETSKLERRRYEHICCILNKASLIHFPLTQFIIFMLTRLFLPLKRVELVYCDALVKLTRPRSKRSCLFRLLPSWKHKNTFLGVTPAQVLIGCSADGTQLPKDAFFTVIKQSCLFSEEIIVLNKTKLI